MAIGRLAGTSCSAPSRFGEGGQVFGERVGEQQPPFLDQGHCRDADDRLGHRIDAEDRVGRHWRPARPQRAEALRIGDAAIARDERRNSRGAAGGDLARHRLADTLQRRTRQSDLFRLGGRQAKHFVRRRVHRGFPGVGSNNMRKMVCRRAVGKAPLRTRDAAWGEAA
jgi:hypothetical protein